MATLSRRLYRSLLPNPRLSQASMSFCTNSISDLSDTESPLETRTSDRVERVMEERPLENGLDSGIFKVQPTKSLMVPIGKWYLFLESSAEIVWSSFSGDIGGASGAASSAEEAQEW